MASDGTNWLFIFLTLYWVYCFFWGIRAMRRTHSAEDFFLAGRALSPWVFALAVTAVTLAAWTFMGFPGLVYRDGFQFVNTASYGIAVGLGGVILQKRQWILGRQYGYVTAGEMFEDYFQGYGLRIASVAVALLFGIPFVALLLGASGFLISELTDQQVSRVTAMWGLSAMVLMYCVTGGMQAVAKIAVVQCALFVLGLLVLGMFAINLTGGFDTLNQGLANIAMNLSGFWGNTNGLGGGSFPGYFAIPGVIQWTAGIGVESPEGGPWTAIMCLSFMFAVMGIQSSPALSMWAFSARSARGFALHQVWGAAFTCGLLMLVFATLIGVCAHLLGANADVVEAEMTTAKLLPAIADNEHNKIVPYFIRLVSEDNIWLLGVLAVCAIAALQATAAAFLSSTGSILTRDLYRRFIHPNADQQRQILAARIVTSLVCLAALLLASYSMTASLLLGSLAISISFQLWPALLGVTRFPWITQKAALLGLVVGVIVVVLTEPIGQRLTAGALPWGRWPWTIHSAIWGMFFNILVCLALSATASRDSNWQRRIELHTFLKQVTAIRNAKRWLKPVAGVIVLVWLFFAIGPGSVIGNLLFGEPNAGYEAWNLGMPSIWAWQIMWWALGVGMVWYLANRLQQSTALEQPLTDPANQQNLDNTYESNTQHHGRPVIQHERKPVS